MRFILPPFLSRDYVSKRPIIANIGRNPLAMDPTRTTSIRKRFIADVRRRFKSLIKEVQNFLVELDALGLEEKKLGVVFNVQARQYQFLSDADKLKAFNEWFKEQVEAKIFSVVPGIDPTKPWTAQYVESAYRKGMFNAYLSSKQADFLAEQGVGQQTADEFLRTAFNQPEVISKIRLLATRSFEGMKGLTASMGADMNRILAQGLGDGKGAKAIAKEMRDRIGSLSESRALTIARSEIIHAHSEGQLDSFQKLGIDELGVRAEWSTAGDDRVCPRCLEMEGKTFTVKQARGLIPLHPSCRCSWIPAFVDNKKKKK